MKSKNVILSLACLALLASCGEKGSKQIAIQEDAAAKKMLQGVWLNEDEESVAFRVKGDTIYYPDSTSQPAYFYIASDTLVMRGSNLVKYPIVKQAPHLFVFKNPNGDVLKLVKTEDKSYLGVFQREHPVALNQNQLIKRDTIMVHGDEKYHLYVQVNPTTYKVYKSSYNDDGVEVDNVYYDNIINLNVFHGASKVFSRDFHKKDFKGKVPASFLEQAILSDVLFGGIDGAGIHFTAILAMPDSSLSYQVDITISFTGNLVIKSVGQ